MTDIATLIRDATGAYQCFLVRNTFKAKKPYDNTLMITAPPSPLPVTSFPGVSVDCAETHVAFVRLNV